MSGNLPMEAIEQQIIELIARAYDAIGWPGVVALMAIESVFFPIPSEAVMPLAGWMLIEAKGHSAWLVLLAGFCGALGSLIGAIVIYAIGLFGGRPLLEKYGRYVLISRNDLDVADRWFERYGTWAVFTSRLLPVARSLISLPAGIARMHLFPFLVLTFLGSFIWSTGLALGGYLLGSNWETLREYMRPFDIPIIALLAVLVLVYVYRRLRRRRKETPWTP